ncbi:MAG: hypothetical protein JOZ69_06305 [Myxococcales bacterium]|nr:hypothetical protein [Myxococcales bacterium]
MTQHRRQIIGLLAAGVLLAGCGSTSPSHSSSRPSASQTGFVHHFMAFASCMRSHGVPSYPDPRVTSSGGVQISPGGGNPNAPAFKSADAACHELLPNGGAPSGASAQDRAQGLKFADCIRAHGIPSFPDPDRDGAFTLPPGVTPQAPAFRQAVAACKSAEPSSLTLNQS